MDRLHSYTLPSLLTIAPATAHAQQMRDAAEQKQELERQHQEAQQELRLKQDEIQKLTKVSEEDRQASLDTIKTLESKVGA